MLCALHLYRDVCQLSFNKLEKKVLVGVPYKFGKRGKCSAAWNHEKNWVSQQVFQYKTQYSCCPAVISFADLRLSHPKDIDT